MTKYAYGWVTLASSRENGDRVEAKIDALLELVGKERGLKVIRAIDESHLRHHGHAQVHGGEVRPE